MESTPTPFSPSFLLKNALIVGMSKYGKIKSPLADLNESHNDA